jgi:glutathionylspermidine synthase
MRTVRWQCTPAEFQDYLKAMRFRYHKWDTFVCGGLNLIPESIVLTEQEHALIVSMTERLAAQLRDLERRVRTRPELLRKLGIPDAVAGMIEREVDSRLQLARYDFFPTTSGGWAVSEFNEDVPGGFNEVVAAPELLPTFHSGFKFVDRFAECFLSAVPNQGTIGLMYATGYSEDMQHMLILKKLLERREQPAVLCSPRHLRRSWGRWIAQGERLSGAVRFYPAEWFTFLENRRLWVRAVQELPMLNPLCRLISQSKAIFALWDDSELTSVAEREFYHSVAPKTVFMTEFCKEAEAVESLRREPGRWVLKQPFGRMGETVAMGSLTPAAEWEVCVKHALQKPTEYVAQDCFQVQPLEFSNGPLYPAIGAYVINGRFAGYYSRVAAQPFLTHQAHYVPTVIDVYNHS